MSPARTYRPSPWEDPDRAGLVARLAAQGEPAALADELLHRSEGVGHRTAAVLRAMPEERRRALAGVVVARIGGAACAGDARRSGMVLLAVISRGFPHQAWCEQWNALLEGWARRWYSSGTSDELPALAEALLDAGRPLSGEVVGLLRRSADDGCLDWAGMLLDRLPEPPVNPGEPWADRVLAQLPQLGEGWRRLIPHLRAAKPAPSERWDRAAAAVLDGIDAGTVRRTVTPWLALAVHGGSARGGGHDPWNLTGVRGLAWLLSSPALPPHPETVRTLGALVERSPVKNVVAGAGVRALARLACGAGQEELRRLAGSVSHTVTRRQIQNALTR
ncbi:hypothetical protein ACIP98_26600 [Streptomyces sp. NPDC088354]|uniref:hypothetical protein n=1 Tax=unclassified Streptomyces TaxID=2593676 RepID=UPI0029A3FA5A|nr:hypothetical protein [Streptomyces sp. MI02-7b]MDX3071943.1 hypothetical protein [Streptomyces sp. MI02-7b]